MKVQLSGFQMQKKSGQLDKNSGNGGRSKKSWHIVGDWRYSWLVETVNSPPSNRSKPWNLNK